MLSSGGYGCLYNPSLPCAGHSSSPEYVTKIQKKSFNSENELEVGKIVAKHDVSFTHFLPVIGACELKLNKQAQSDVVSECSAVESTDDLQAANLPYMEHQKFSAVLQSRPASEYFLCLTENYKYLLSSLELLGSLDIVHYDLKLDNILFRKISSAPRIVDFGISIPVKNLNSSNLSRYFYIYAPEYSVWPIQPAIICYLLHVSKKRLTKTDCTIIADNHARSNPVYAHLSTPKQYRQYKDACLKYVTKFKNVPRQNVITELLKTYKHWDNYSLSLIFASLLLTCFPSPLHRNRFIDLWLELLLNNMDPSLNKALPPRESFYRFLDLFYVNESVESYLRLKAQMASATMHTTATVLEMESLRKPGR